jgi:arylsulfatase A-like enzyme
MSKREESKAAQRKNAIWIFTDQHRAQALGYMGDPNLSTPVLDRMAMEGMVFDRAVCGFPLCCPFRGSLLTSRYPHKCVPGHEYPLPTDQRTIAHAFNDNGYHTAYFGKWHLDGFRESQGRAAMHIVPPERRGGFQTWVGYDNNNSQYDCWVHGGEGADAFHYRLPGYETDCLTDLLINHLKDQAREAQEGKGRPFFAVLSVQPPHTPNIAPEEWMRRHTPGQIQLRPNVPMVPRVVEKARRQLAGYYAQIENVDWNIGRVRAALEELGLANDTHLVFFSDHGDMMGSHGQFQKMTPLEESIRVPFMVGGCQPHYEFKTGFTNHPVNHVDIAPTTLGLCGIPVPDWMEGTDYSGLRLKSGGGGSDLPDSAFLQSVIPTMHGDSVDRPWRGVVTRDNWKYAVLKGQPWLMFNLNEDPFEQVNLAHNVQFRAKRAELQARLKEWIEKTEDNFELPAL